MLRIFSLIVLVCIFIVAVVYATGYTANSSYQNSIQVRITSTRWLVWQQLMHIDKIPERKSDVTSIETIEEYGKLIVWKENLKNGGYRIYRMSKRIEGEELVLDLIESSQKLTGTWKFILKEGDSQETIITIEESSVENDVLRRGYYVFFGREYNLLVWEKYIKVGLIQTLLTTP